MKGLIYGGLSTLLIAGASAGTFSPAQAEQVTSGEMTIPSPW